MCHSFLLPCSFNAATYAEHAGKRSSIKRIDLHAPDIDIGTKMSLSSHKTEQQRQACLDGMTSLKANAAFKVADNVHHAKKKLPELLAILNMPQFIPPPQESHHHVNDNNKQYGYHRNNAYNNDNDNVYNGGYHQNMNGYKSYNGYNAYNGHGPHRYNQNMNRCNGYNKFNCCCHGRVHYDNDVLQENTNSMNRNYGSSRQSNEYVNNSRYGPY